MLLKDKVRLLFDGEVYEVSGLSNLVEAMDEKGVHIIAPCFRNGRKNGCCKVCIVEMNGKKSFACGLTPKEGMNIIYNRQDLKEERKIAAKKYAEQSTDESTCCSSSHSISGGCGCESNDSPSAGCC